MRVEHANCTTADTKARSAACDACDVKTYCRLVSRRCRVRLGLSPVYTQLPNLQILPNVWLPFHVRWILIFNDLRPVMQVRANYACTDGRAECVVFCVSGRAESSRASTGRVGCHLGFLSRGGFYPSDRVHLL